jgi:CHAT domain-containing protein
VYPEDGPIRLWLIQNSIPPGCAIIEYYMTSSSIFVALIAKESIRVVRLASLSAVKPPLDLLKFHFGRRRNHDGVNVQDSAQRHHLAELYDHLVRPIRRLITATHLIIIPHGPLHQVPYHALLNGDRFLIDDFAVTYAPSATLFYQSLRRPLNRQTLSLVMGVPDKKAPYIEEEIQTVADLLPRAIHCLGDRATEAVLRRHASESRYIHIASLSRFRPDNPMFSSIQLSDFKLNVFDLHQIEIRADLVTLSGCSTGVNDVAQGDELVGMARGFLRAGARSVMTTLWDVDDRSTSEFMKLFYSSLATGAPIQQALRSAMLKLREEYPAPYFWAPFVVSGGIGMDIEQSR